MEQPEDAGRGGADQEGGDSDGHRHLHGDAHKRAVRHVPGLLVVVSGRLSRLGQQEDRLGRLAAGDGPRLGQPFPRDGEQVERSADSHLLEARFSEIETIEILTLAFKRHQGHNQFNMFQRSRLRTNVKMLANL